MSEYMEVPCKYCKKKNLMAINWREYESGLFVVSAKCNACGKSQKVSNKVRRDRQ